MSVEASDRVVEPLVILTALIEALEIAGIRFCHWKSNGHLAEAVGGHTDLDLLVDHRQAEQFRRVLGDMDFKPLVAAPGKRYPEVENHLGFDPSSGRLVHLHVHFQLVLGQQFVKDYRLPIEDWVLRSVRLLHGVPVPGAEVELIILTVRAALKYRIRDAVKDTIGHSRPGIPRHITSEFRWLLDQTSRPEVLAALDERSDCLPAGLIEHILDTLAQSERQGWKLLTSRQQLRKALRPYRRISRAHSTVTYLIALLRKRLRGNRKRRMTLRDGGVTIGFVGADGAGKSTVVTAIRDWLGWRLDVVTVYMGIGSPGPGIRVLKVVGRLAHAVDRRAVGRPLAAVAGRVSNAVLGWRRVLEMRHRRRRYRSTRRDAARGAVVLFDRFPLASISVLGRSMDGPRLRQELEGRLPDLMQRLAALEEQAFRNILPPERLIALDVSPDVSLGRKPDHDRHSIHAKSRAVEDMARRDASVAVVDADQPLPEVVARVKSIIWGWM